MSKTTYTLDVIKNLIREKQQFDLSKFCKNILDEEYSGVERTLENITHDLKNEIIQFGKKNNISVYQMMLSSKTYDLQAQKIV